MKHEFVNLFHTLRQSYIRPPPHLLTGARERVTPGVNAPPWH